jgi:hypothetical protein
MRTKISSVFKLLILSAVLALVLLCFLFSVASLNNNGAGLVAHANEVVPFVIRTRGNAELQAIDYRLGGELRYFVWWLAPPQVPVQLGNNANGAPINSGDTITYQWARRNEAGVFVDIAGATGHEFAISQVSESGRYRCTVDMVISGTPRSYSFERDATVRAQEVTPNWPSVAANRDFEMTFSGLPLRPSVSVLGDRGEVLTVAHASDNNLSADFVVNITNRDEAVNLQPAFFTSVGRYTAHIASQNPNYVVHNSVSRRSFNYAIIPTVVEVEWTGRTGVPAADAFTYTYNAEEQFPSPSASFKFTNLLGVLTEIDVILTVRDQDMFVNAGQHIAVAESTNPNFVTDFASRQVSFRIMPAAISVNWGALQFTYDPRGVAQFPTPTATGINDVAVSLSSLIFIPTPNFGVNVGSYTVGVTVVSGDDNRDSFNYSLTNASTAFEIVPLPVEVVWRTVGGAEVNLTHENDQWWWNEELFPTFNATNQSGLVNVYMHITAHGLNTFTRVDAIFSSAFINAGNYTVEARLRADQTNFQLLNAQLREINITIQKAKPVITVTGVVNENELHFVRRGMEINLPVAVVAAGGGVPLVVEQSVGGGWVTISNRFNSAGFFSVRLSTPAEHANFVKAEPVYLNIFIKETSFSSGGIGIVYDNGALAGSEVLLQEKDVSALAGFRPGLARNVENVFKISLTNPQGEVEISGDTKVTFRLPEELGELSHVRIIRKVNGRYVETVFEVNNGLVEFNLHEDGFFAITTVNSENVFIWWLVFGSVVAIAVLIAAITTKRGKYLKRNGGKRYIKRH